MKLLFLIATVAAGLGVFTGLKLQATSEAKTDPETPSQGGDVPSKVSVYVANFELDVIPLQPGERPAAPPANAAQPGSKSEPPDPLKQASHLVDTMSLKLVAALQRAGYPAQRLRPGQGRPDNGVQIRGIFAEVDSQNHWRRAVIRTGADTGQMNALVAVGNLARPDQVLYEIANLPGNTNQPGAVITLSPYVPLERFDINKEADENVFARIASRVVADLDAFLSKNPAALPQ